MKEPGVPVPQPSRPARLVSRPVKKGLRRISLRAVDPVEAVVGLCFDHGGYLHEVIEIDDDGAVTKVSEAGARLAVPFGSWSGCSEFPGGLAHPNHGIAFERLRAWRTQRAGGKPAYTVLTDETLRALAIALPV